VREIARDTITAVEGAGISIIDTDCAGTTAVERLLQEST
jgi:hypothetical protein